MPAQLVLLSVAVVLAWSTRGSAVEWSDPVPLAARPVMLDAVEAGARMVAVGDRGTVLVSTDVSTWTQSRVPTRSMLTAVTAVGDAVWAAGHDTVIVHSPDGGTTWVRQHFARGDTPVLDLWFADARRGLAVGAYGLALQTADGGGRWTRVTIDREERHLNGLAAGGARGLYVAAEDGFVFRSRDGGETWDAVPTPYNGSLFGAVALRDGAVVVFGLRGHVFRSDDEGATWRPLESGTNATLLAGVQTADGRLLIVGLSGTVLVSDDGRRLRLRNRPDRRGLAAALPLGDGRILLLGEEGIVPMLGDLLEERGG
jgi:photosystem II stability/assembly factor-like uncharacterized protein